ncbi:hypothetical protein [Alloactinosynnema sp. L-07]|nr:hypothetical protein [Alloactinosynnema sp. L-07]
MSIRSSNVIGTTTRPASRVGRISPRSMPRPLRPLTSAGTPPQMASAPTRPKPSALDGISTRCERLRSCSSRSPSTE